MCIKHENPEGGSMAGAKLWKMEDCKKSICKIKQEAT